MKGEGEGTQEIWEGLFKVEGSRGLRGGEQAVGAVHGYCTAFNNQ